MTAKSSAKRTTRLVYGTFVLLVALFTFANVWQVAWRLFGGGGADSAPSVAVGDACGAALSSEIQDIERARLLASQEKNAAAGRDRYRRERIGHPGEKGVATRACEGDPHGLEAVAALDRLDRAAEAHAVRESGELSPVRLEAQSFIRGPNQ